MKLFEKWGKVIFPLITLILIVLLFNLLAAKQTIGLIIMTTLPFLFSFLIAWILNPVVTTIHKKFKIPRWVAALIVSVLIIVIFIIIILLIVPEMVTQISELVKLFPNLGPSLTTALSSVQGFFGFEISTDLITKFNTQIISLVQSLLSNTASIVSSSVVFLGNLAATVFIVFMILMASIYILIDFDKFVIKLNKIIPKRFSEDVSFLEKEVNRVLVGYLRGLIVETILVGILAYIAFLIAGLDSALTFAFIIGITNIIPYVGPYIGAVPVSIFALTESVPLFWAVIIIVLVVQQIDGILIKPKVFGKTTDVHPSLSIIAIILFGKLFGIIGIIFAIPIAGLIIVLIKFTYKKLVIKYPEIMK